MKKQGILKIFAGMMLIVTTTACGSSSAGVKNVDLKDPDGDYHVQVDFKTNEVTLSCDVENDDTGTGEGWSEILRDCNRDEDSAINFETMSFNTTYKMSDDFKKVFKDFWENDFQNEYSGVEIDEEGTTSDIVDICRFLALGEQWEENPNLFVTERPVVEDGAEGAVEVFVTYDGKKEKFQKADTDKDGYISVQEYIKMMVSNYEETIKEFESI